MLYTTITIYKQPIILMHQKKVVYIINLQHRLQISRNLERSGSLAADLLDGHALGVLGKSQTLGGADFEDGQIGDDLPHAAGSGQGEAALGEDLGVALLVGVFLFKLCQWWTFKCMCGGYK